MKHAEARLGRALVVRLEDGDVVHESIEAAARDAGIARAAVLLLGGAGGGSRVVVGEAVITELVGSEATRRVDPARGFGLLDV